MRHPRTLRRAALGALAAAVLSRAAAAHDGPPFPILVDEPLAGRTVSVWADPDVGLGTFFVYVEPDEGAAQALLPLRIQATPHDSRWEESTALVEAVDDSPFQLLGEVPFEDRGTWTVHFIHGSSGEELVVDVEVTPPGSFGPIDILWFLFPFLAIGFLWIKGMLRQRAHDRNSQVVRP